MPPLPVVRWLLIINFAVFCLQNIFSWMGKNAFDAYLALSGNGIAHWFLWQFFTYMFLHADVFHLLFNLLGLYFFGNEVESAIGSKRFIRMYLLGGLVGGFLWYAFNFHHHAVMVGASGAIYAVIIAFATLYPNRPITLLVFFVLPVTLLAKYLAIVVVAISVLYSMSTVDHVAHLAHLGGMGVGYLFIKSLGTSIPWFSWLKFLKRHHSTPPSMEVLRSKTKKDEFIQEQIDPILDKIAQQGIQSLSREERRLLNEAKDRLP